MQRPDPLEDVVGGLLLELTRGICDLRKPERLAVADGHPRKLKTLPVADLVGAEDRHRNHRSPRLEGEAPDARLGLVGQLAGPGAPSLAVHADRAAALQDLVGARERLLVLASPAYGEHPAVAEHPLGHAGSEELGFGHELDPPAD